MDYSKTIPFDSFLEYKNILKGRIFPVKVEIYQYANNWLPLQSEIVISNNITKDDYELTFMDEYVPMKPYLGYAEMDVSYLTNVKFEQPYLYFTTSDSKKVRLS